MEEAKNYQKTNGGYIVWEERTPKRKQLTWRGKDYTLATDILRVDRKEYPFGVMKNNALELAPARRAKGGQLLTTKSV